MIPYILEGDSGYLKSVIWGILKVAATAGPLFKKKTKQKPTFNNNNKNKNVQIEKFILFLKNISYLCEDP